MSSSTKFLVTSNEKPYWYGILGWCLWKGDLCFKSEILNILLKMYFDTFCLHTCSTLSQLLYVSKPPFTVTAWIKSKLDDFLYCNPFVFLLGPPVVEIVPPAQFTLRGVTASFTCYAKGFPLPDIVWMKQNGSVENEISASSVNVQIKPLNGSSQLIVQNTSTADSGYYICKASNYVSDIARAFLGVVGKLHLNMWKPLRKLK